MLAKLKTHRKKLIIIGSGVLCVVIVLIVLYFVFEPKTIGDLAYDVKPLYGYTVYIKENGEYEPYLVD
jgi:hypothetical protein